MEKVMSQKPLLPEQMPLPLIVENVSKEMFETKLQPMGIPFVIKGFANEWEIVKRDAQKADIATYLQQALCDPPIKMQLTRIPQTEHSRMFYAPNMSEMSFGVAELPPLNCFERMTCITRDADYAAQCVPVAKYFPKLTADLSNPLLANEVSPFIWFGNKVIVAPHFDEANNIAVVAAGKRRFTLFPPQQTKNLYIGPLEFTPAGQPISLVDILSPDLSTHPRYAEAFAHGMSVELVAGDAIYIPTPWWHHVQSLSEFNVLINYWFNDSTLATTKPLSALLHAIQAFRCLPAPQRDGFKAMLDYYVFDSKIDTHQHIPAHAKGLLGDLTHSNRVELERWIKALL
jgi:hypothetical protein